MAKTNYKDLKITPEAHRKLRLYIAEKDIDTFSDGILHLVKEEDKNE